MGFRKNRLSPNDSKPACYILHEPPSVYVRLTNTIYQPQRIYWKVQLSVKLPYVNSCCYFAIKSDAPVRYMQHILKFHFTSTLWRNEAMISSQKESTTLAPLFNCLWLQESRKRLRESSFRGHAIVCYGVRRVRRRGNVPGHEWENERVCPLGPLGVRQKALLLGRSRL